MQDGRVPVAAAAAPLGVTAETLRKRLWRGQIPDVKLDDQWFVYVSGTEQDQRQDLSRTRQDRQEDSPVPSRTASMTLTPGSVAPSSPRSRAR
jgi:hypothetical protein